MSDKKDIAAGSLISELFQFGVYKRSQGRIIRQLTFFALLTIVAVGCWKLGALINADPAISLGVPAVLLAVGIWLSFRAVNMPRFADFLIAVEAEMNKVSWPSKGELVRSSIVVIFTIAFLVAVLFVYDILWHKLFQLIGIVS